MSVPDQGNGFAFDTQGYARAYSTYNRYRKTLKRILQETQELHTNPSGIHPEQYPDLAEKKLTASEESLLENSILNQLAFVILGQTYKSKCLFANKLLGQDILPVGSKTWLHRAQTTRFKHGPRPQVSISLHDNLVIIEPRLHSSSNDSGVDWEQEFSLLEEDLKKVDGGIVEITLNHSILKGCQVIICRGDETLSDVIHCDKLTIIRSDLCVDGVAPLFVYTFEKEWIYAKEVQILKKFLLQYPDNAIVFSLQNHHISCEETENHVPNGCQCDESHSQNGDATFFPHNGRPKVMLPIDINSPHCQEDDLLSPTHHDVCNNRLNKDSPLNCDDDNWVTKRSKLITRGSSNMEGCVKHTELSQGTRKLVKDLTSIGFRFGCTCRGAKRQLYRNGTVQDSSSETKSTSERTIKESCTRTNPGYVALNFDVFINDMRLQNFPPASVFVLEQRSERLQYRVLSFTRSVAKYYLVRAAKVLHKLHSSILDNSIRSAFQMSRDLMITPRRMEYAKQQENQLFSQLLAISTKKQNEIQDLISGIKISLRENILNAAEGYNVPDEEISFRQVSVVKKEIQDLVLHHIKEATAERLYSSIQILKESYIGTLSRCLECLESSVEEENEGTTSKHLKKILHTAYDVELNIQSSSSLARIMIDKLRQLLSNLPWHEPPVMDTVWRRNVASDVLASLDDSRLAKSICSQFRARLHQSHSAFNASLRQLETTHLCRLELTEEKRHKVAKIVAPHVARLALESTSMIDSVLFGMPRMGREIGRGMYGVVYQCDQWSSWGPCAVKSVAPPDEKHANDLSLEFYYTRSLPEHPRIVQIRGSIIDESYAGGIGPPAVLLIMDRMHCDLYTSIKRGLNECMRMQIAIDVVEGIRFLHSQGLVHRDIKLKNVLLDRRHRAKITDLGFCKPGAMISGSIVGTPVHMPPELFTGKYDNSVDVYAFGILFWYLCAGVTRLPRNFEACTTKDHLWNAVRKGVRPERLPIFADDCWHLMKACWNSDPMKRPLLGKIQPRITAIHSRIKKRDAPAIDTTSDSTTL